MTTYKSWKKCVPSENSASKCQTMQKMAICRFHSTCERGRGERTATKPKRYKKRIDVSYLLLISSNGNEVMQSVFYPVDRWLLWLQLVVSGDTIALKIRRRSRSERRRPFALHMHVAAFCVDQQFCRWLFLLHFTHVSTRRFFQSLASCTAGVWTHVPSSAPVVTWCLSWPYSPLHSSICLPRGHPFTVENMLSECPDKRLRLHVLSLQWQVVSCHKS